MLKPSLKHWFSSCCVVLSLGACSFGSSSDGPSAAPPPPPPLPSAPPGTKPSSLSLPSGAPADALKALDALGQLSKGGDAALGPVVSFRDLAPFLKDEIGGFKADRELDGKTTSMRGMQVSEVKRSYKNGEQTLRLSITDTSLAPFMRAGFAMAQMIQEDSTKGYKKGGEFQGHPGIAEWKESGRSELHVLAGGRFLIDISISKASAGAAEQLFGALDVPGIVATAKNAKDNAAAIPAQAQGN
jgi:hypothetical protein